MKRLLTELEMAETPTIQMDSTSALHITSGPKMFQKLKHLDLQTKFLIREVQELENISFVYVPTEENAVDLLSKPMARPRCEYLRRMLGLVQLPM